MKLDMKTDRDQNQLADTGERIATRADLLVTVFSACLLLLLTGVIVDRVPDSAFFVAVCAAFVYLVFLCGWAYWRMHQNPLVLDNRMEALLESTLGLFIQKMHVPVLICDEFGNLCWYNDEIAPYIQESGAAIGCAVNSMFNVWHNEKGDCVKLGDKVYTYDAIGTVNEGKRYFFVILQDVSELLNLQDRYENERVAVAYISIDNIDEVMKYVHENFRDAASDVDDKLKAWANSVGGILKSYDSDHYVMFFDAYHLNKAIENRFDILDKVRSTRVGDGISITISMGVSKIQGTLAEREAAAQAALDLALQRGGDQVVYKSEDGVEYYGGRTKAVYKRTNVKARVTARTLYSLIARADNVLIMGHRYGDFDSFGAAVGMARMVMLCGAQPRIAVNRNDKNLSACIEHILKLDEYDHILIGENEALSMIVPDTLLIVVDVNNFAHVEFPSVVEKAQHIAVVDHHIKTAEHPDTVVLDYIEPSASSASELVSELIEYSMTSSGLRREEADLMMAGILLDTKQFTRSTGTRTFSAARFLQSQGANPAVASEMFRMDAVDLTRESRFMSNIEIFRQHMAISCVEGETDPAFRVAAAKVAEKLLTIKNVDASFALVQINGNIHISARSNGRVNVQLILEKLRGGGHFDVAGAQVMGESMEHVLGNLKKSIEEYLLVAPIDHRDR